MGIDVNRPSKLSWIIGILLMGSAAFWIAHQSSRGPGETLEFVVVDWQQALPKTARGHCPQGINKTELEYFGVSRKELQKEIREIGYEDATQKLLPPDACQNPMAQEDPGFFTLESFVAAPGLDLDRHNSKKDGSAECSHNDFVDMNLKPGIDNQYARLVGCSKAYLQGGFMNLHRKPFGNQYSFDQESRVLLIEIRGVHDRRNDTEVEVRVSSGSGGLRLSSAGSPLPHVSFSQNSDSRFHGEFTEAEIIEGRLRTKPMDLRVRLREGILDDALYWKDAQLQASIDDSGNLNGTIGYFWDTENLFRIMNDHDIDGIHTGRLAALGRGYMCAGLFHAMNKIADGHPDPQSGACTSISAAHQFQAIPAFVIEPSGTPTDAPR